MRFLAIVDFTWKSSSSNSARIRNRDACNAPDDDVSTCSPSFASDFFTLSKPEHTACVRVHQEEEDRCTQTSLPRRDGRRR